MTENERLILFALDTVLRTLAQVPESRGIVDRAHAAECADVAARIDNVLRAWEDVRAKRDADAPNYEAMPHDAPIGPDPTMSAVDRAAASAARRARAYDNRTEAASVARDAALLARGD